MLKRYAFTLAEILITLGIIGIIAAMTLPAIIQKHKRTIVETRLEKFYSAINQAIKISELKNGDKIHWEPKDTDDFWNNYIKPYIKYTQSKEIIPDMGAKQKIVYLPDGSAFIMDLYFATNNVGDATLQTKGGHFIFCPEAKTCEQGMDKTAWGKKQFVFGFWPNEDPKTGGHANMEYHKGKGVEPYLHGWKGDEKELYTHTSNGCNPNARNFYCTAVIQHNGWKIPKNYPYKF